MRMKPEAKRITRLYDGVDEVSTSRPGAVPSGVKAGPPNSRWMPLPVSPAA